MQNGFKLNFSENVCSGRGGHKYFDMKHDISITGSLILYQSLYGCATYQNTMQTSTFTYSMSKQVLWFD